MRATIKMIAEKAGVSIGTVDRVLHNRPYVKAEVREKVLQVMEELEYRPNRMASALALSGISRRLAVIQPGWDGYIRDEMEKGVARFQEERRDYNVTVDIYTYPKNDTETCLRLTERAVKEDARGIALCASDCLEVRAKLEELSRHRIPVVTFNSDIPAGPRLCYVGEDAHHAGRVAGEIASKFTRPGQPILLAYGGPAYAGHKGRADGFLERLEEVGFRREDCQIVATHDAYDPTFQAVRQALTEDPTLSYIYMANASVPACVDAIRLCREKGQVRVLSHDSGPEIRQLLKSGEVDFTIGQDLAYQSSQALSLLHGLIVEHRQPEKDCYYSVNPILGAETV